MKPGVAHTSEWKDIEGSYLQGHIRASYDRLVAAFGEPTDMHEGDGDKSDAEWLLKFDDGTVATIYNWKNGKSYCGENGTPLKQITDWNIGGFKPAAVEKVRAYV